MKEIFIEPYKNSKNIPNPFLIDCTRVVNKSKISSKERKETGMTGLRYGSVLE